MPRQRCCRTNLPLEAFDGVGIIETFFTDQFDGSNAAQVAMAGLENLTHAAFAQSFQQDIRSQDKLLASPQEQLIGLVGSEPASFNQLTSECLWV